MVLYECSAGEYIRGYYSTGDEVGVDWYKPYEIIEAETRGKARARFTANYGLEFTARVSIKRSRIPESPVYRIAGLLRDHHDPPVTR